MRDTTMPYAALVCWNMRYHPIPVRDGDKKAAIEWAPYQTQRP